jgi:hypothetical protein
MRAEKNWKDVHDKRKRMKKSKNPMYLLVSEKDKAEEYMNLAESFARSAVVSLGDILFNT